MIQLTPDFHVKFTEATAKVEQKLLSISQCQSVKQG
jgi:hypothetical protein